MQDFAAGKNLHDIYHGWPQVNFVQIFAEEEILNVISILYPKEILIINGKNVMFHDLGISLHGKTDIPHESWGISILNCDFDFILLKIPIILTLDFNYFSPLLGIKKKYNLI